MGVCDCPVCPNGAPAQYKVTFSNTTNGTCTQCTQFNNTFTLSTFQQGAQGCFWAWSMAPTICNYGQIWLKIVPNGSNYDMQVYMTTGTGGPVWTASGIKSCLDPSYTLTRTSSGTDCNWPLTVTVNTVPMVLSGTNAASCVPALLIGCPSGQAGGLQNVASLGTTSKCCPTCGCSGCGCGCSCGSQGSCSCGPTTPPTSVPLLAGGCKPTISDGCPPGSGPSYPAGPLSQAGGVLNQWQQQASRAVPGADTGPAHVNVSSGNLLLQLGPPAAGPFDSLPVLTYNATSPTSSEFGYGWIASHKNTLTPNMMDMTKVDITNGYGTVLHFTGKDASNRFLPPASTADALVQNGDGSYTQTQPKGLQLRYPAGMFGSVNLSRISNPAGARWTLGYDAGGRVQSITDPFNRRTSYVYTGGGQIRRVQVHPRGAAPLPMYHHNRRRHTRFLLSCPKPVP